jgi:AcrR family transcriptional regulator
MRHSAKTRRQKQAETRSSLLRSAAKLFCRHGLEGASVEDVAQAAGYTKGAFYSNFKSKEELFLVMLDEKFAAELERIDRELAGTGEPNEEARHAAENFVRYVHSDPEWPRLYFEFVAYAARNEDFRQELATRHRAVRARLTDVYRRWSAGFPAEPPLPMEDIAAMTDFMADGFILDKLVDPELDDRLYATMLTVFFRGLQAMALGWEPEDAVASSSTSA